MNELTPKTFWEKPEGKAGALVLILIVVGGGYVFIKALPTLLLLMENTLYLAGMMCVLGAILFLAFNAQFRTTLWYMYQMIMRSLTGLLVQLDPIKILEAYIQHLRDSIAKVDEQITNLKKEVSKLKGAIDRNSAEMERNLKIAKAAKDSGDTKTAALHARQAERLNTSNTNLGDLYKKLDSMYKMLARVYDNATYLLQDTENEVDSRKREYAAMTAGHSAFKSAMKIIKGDDDKLALFNQSMEFVVDDVRAKVGEMERFMELSEKTLKGVDLENAVFEADGFKLLEEWEQNSNILNDKKAEKTSGKPSSSYSDLF